MNIVYHPVSGEKGYFCSETERKVIETIIQEFLSGSDDVASCTNARGGAVE